MGNSIYITNIFQLIKGGLETKKGYNKERSIMLDKIKKEDTTIYLLGKKQSKLDINEVEKYKIPVGYYGEINPANLRIVATKKVDTCHFYYLC